jgi:hypothetical protein
MSFHFLGPITNATPCPTRKRELREAHRRHQKWTQQKVNPPIFRTMGSAMLDIASLFPHQAPSPRFEERLVRREADPNNGWGILELAAASKMPGVLWLL